MFTQQFCHRLHAGPSRHSQLEIILKIIFTNLPVVMVARTYQNEAGIDVNLK